MKPIWSKSIAATLLLLTAACAAPNLAMPSATNLDAFASRKASKAKFGMGAVITRDEPDVSGDTGMRIQADLPDSADLRPNMPPVANQAHFGSCTAFAIIKGFREYLARKEGRNDELSARFFWYAERKFLDQKYHPDTPADATVLHNTGVPTGFGMATIKIWGTIKEKAFPYPTLAEFGTLAKLDEPAQNAKLDEWAAVAPSAAAFQESKKLKVDQSIFATGSIHGMRKALSEKKPVVIAVRLFESFQSEEAGKTGLIPVPNQKKEKEIGGHAMCAVGFDNTRKVVIVRNSWGTGWGDKGYCYIPYEYFKLKDGEGRGLVRGGWTIR